MSQNNIPQVIRDIFNTKEMLENIDGDQDFFDLGASSLTVVDLQIQIEEALKLAVETHNLMADPTIDGWVSLYSKA